MWYKRIPNLSKSISPLVFGTSALGSESGYRYKFLKKERRKIFSLFDFVFDQGINSFDTAAVYMLGESEKILGEWINSNGIRDKVIVISKGSHPNYVWLPSKIYGKARLQEKQISKDIRASLTRLKMDYIDIYMPHRDDASLEVGPLIRTYNHFLESGRISVLGCSNWSHQRIQDANLFASSSQLRGFEISSPHYSFFDWKKSPWKGTVSISGHKNINALEWYGENNIPILAWSPLGGGLASKWINSGIIYDRAYDTDRNREVLSWLLEISRDSCASMEELILSWMSKHSKPDIFPIIKSMNEKNILKNIESVELELTPNITKQLTMIAQL